MLSNLLPSQEMFDHEASCIATNHSAFGVQNVTVPSADISVQELYGMNLISYTPNKEAPASGKPEALQLTADSPNSFKFMQDLLGNMQQMSNIELCSTRRNRK